MTSFIWFWLVAPQVYCLFAETRSPIVFLTPIRRMWLFGKLLDGEGVRAPLFVIKLFVPLAALGHVY
jgi:hypothetical protein